MNQNLGSSVRTSRLFYFLQFQALSSSLDIQTLQLLQLSKYLSLWSFFAPLYYRGIEITFSKAVEECPEVLGCWIVSESSVEDFRRSIFFCKALLTVAMLAMFWFQILRHLVEWIFHSIWWVGRFHRSPFANILKLFSAYSKVFGNQKSI